MFSGTPVEPSSYHDVPADYVLGRGDSVVIDLFGSSQMQVPQRIKSDGKVTIPVVGPVSLQGLTIPEATRRLKSAVAPRFAESNIELTLAEPRLIEVTVRGEVARPGKYLVHGYSTLLYVLHKAGGITKEGTMRAVHLQSGEIETELDLYDNLLASNQPQDPQLKDGDVIFVPTAKNLVQLDGLVKREATYELFKEQTLGDILDYAGGITEKDVRIRVKHRGAESNRIETMDIAEANGYAPTDGDIVTIEKTPDKPNEVVEVQGNVQHRGKYRLDDSCRKLADILKIATPNVGKKQNIVLVYRDSVLVQVGDAPMELQGREEIFVEPAVVHVEGEVLHATDVDFAESKTVKTYIQEAGGYTRHASRLRVFVVSPDGRVHSDMKNTRLVPGCRIIVPKR